MYNYFFHKDNAKKFKNIEKEFKEILSKKLYQEAMGEVKTKYLSTYQRLVLKGAKKGNIINLKLLYDIKRFVKNMTI